MSRPSALIAWQGAGRRKGRAQRMGRSEYRAHCGVARRLSGAAKRRSLLLSLRPATHVRKPVMSGNRPYPCAAACARTAASHSAASARIQSRTSATSRRGVGSRWYSQYA